MFTLEVSSLEEEEEDECLEEEVNPEMNEYVMPKVIPQYTPYISLNALSGIPTYNTMRVKGHVLR